MSDPFPWDDELEREPSPHEQMTTAAKAHGDAEALTAAVPALVQDQPIDLDGILDHFAANPRDRDVMVAGMRDRTIAVVRHRAVQRQDANPARPEPAAKPSKPLTESDVRAEVVGAADDHDTLRALGSALILAADEAKAITADVMADVPPTRGQVRRTMRVNDGGGFRLEVKEEPRRELKVNADEVADVLTAWLTATAPPADVKVNVLPAKVYAAATRRAIRELRNLLSASPAFKSTALDALVTTMQGAGDDALASRLTESYSRVDVGEPRVTLNRTPIEPPKPADTTQETSS